MTEMNLDAVGIDFVMRELDLTIGEAVAFVGLKAWTSLTIKTPVGNPTLWKSKPPKNYVGGQARSSWKMKHGSPDATLPRSWSATMPAPPNIKAMELQPLYVTSVVPYMTKLEEGHSTQGSHMMKRTISEIKYEFNSIIGK